ncbi:glutathione peroxidase [Nocardiopsis sp. TSRI0078]|uniref:glutathione peroxidase n=1 Tax=unclassified Nocardiopsis TaxID=2649073 RepID=UPI00093E2488|nr:glutathione peroxidase [Nocardiopsis sp. TSRI0078]OKI21911.1 glutathione peroxidase [Nocardiopsis sp. TSRI0078]
MTPLDLDDIPVTLIDGRRTTFGEWSGKVRLVVNVASRCGLTPQYARLEGLQHRYGDRGFTVLGFPSNQFLQEFGNERKIAGYCAATWGVTFPMMSKVRVNGRNRHPLYAALASVPDGEGRSGRVRWNFEKFLVLPDGTVHRFRPNTVPDDPGIVGLIEEALSRRAG